MDDNTHYSGITLGCTLVGAAIIYACHSQAVRTDFVVNQTNIRASELAIQKESNLQSLRIECVKTGQLWVADSQCVPVNVKTGH